MKGKVVLLLISICSCIITYILLVPMFQIYKSDDTTCIEISVVYEKGNVSPQKNFTKEFWKGDMVPIEGCNMKVYFLQDNGILILKPEFTIHDYETDKEIDRVYLPLGEPVKVKINKNVVVITFNKAYVKENPDGDGSVIDKFKQYTQQYNPEGE